MQLDPLHAIAQAVLYEGYLLYPYRLSSVKNRKRFTFGVLYPPSYADREGEPKSAHAEVLATTAAGIWPDATACLRFLEDDGSGSYREREEPLQVAATAVAPGLWRLAVTIRNDSGATAATRDEALVHAKLSAHAVLRISNGRFHSMTDPEPGVSAYAKECRQQGLWPVLAGDETRRDAILAAPIILPDFPRVAAASPGDLFDGLEIDEILSLRVRTLTDAEKTEMRAADPRAAALLARTEGLTDDQLIALHARCASPYQPGMKVKLRPKGGGDIFDLALAGRSATVLGIETDFEGRSYVTVSVDDDPGQDLAALGQPGHRFFFDESEVELL